MQQAIIDFHLDEENDWVADLACGHGQHVRHNPPWQNRPWVITEQGRKEKLGVMLECKKCEEEINHNLSRFNESGIEPFRLSVSMGYTEFGTEDDAETFLMHMDEKMYEEKRKYHMRKKSAGLENKV